MDLIKDWWGAFAALIGSIFWLARLEWRSIKNEADIRRLEKQRDADMVTAQKSRDEVQALLKEARDDLREVRADIKALLQRNGGGA